ncbi:NmrA family NAD(P)-binding protein [Catenulispora rubra]|uniref:NmrA family NAD(P)-binding protein n=1 Tax=Catenulispora rubra TaxID=280293 RepID=UPI00189267B0|nr:NAD(P)H-binding protein [Catenulispora rubra]
MNENTNRNASPNQSPGQSPENSPILVLGASGKTGRRVADRLEAAGANVRRGSRSASPAFDWDDPAGWPAVLQDVTSVYVSFFPDIAVPGAPETIAEFTAAARQAGVRHVVLLSGRGEAEAQRAEEVVAESGLEWTVVRASFFAQNFSEGAFYDAVMSGEVVLPVDDMREPFIDVDDIADVAVAALTEDGHHGQIYEVTGPRLLTFAEAVSAIAESSGRQVTYTSVPLEAFTAFLAEAGEAPEVIEILAYLFSEVLDGRNAYVADGVQRAIGRPPRDFAEYARTAAENGAWK